MGSLTLEAVDKRFGDVVALAGVDLAVGDGEAVCLLGPSGSGKSTALRIAAGLERVSAGHVLIGGVDVTSHPAARRDVSMVFQSYALFPHLDVAENIGFGLAVRRTPKDVARRRVGEVAELVSCAHLLSRRPHELSGGERQRVALARALARRPAVLLLDEPLSNLDAPLRAELRVELLRLHATVGATMVHVTHDQVEAMAIGDRVAVIRDGSIEQTGSPDDVYRRPVNRFVATFVGTPRMNVLPVVRDGSGPAAGPFPLPERLVPDLPAVAGIRPHHVHLGNGAVTARVDVVERSGDDVVSHLVTGDHRIVARCHADRRLRPGDLVSLHASPDHWYVFDATTGRTLRQAS